MLKGSAQNGQPTIASRTPGIHETTTPPAGEAFALPANRGRNDKRGCRKRDSVPWAGAPLRGESWRRAPALINSANYVRSTTEGFPDAEAQAKLDWRSSLNKAAADGVENEVAEGMKIELEHDSSAVTLHRSCADQEFRTYFLVRLANGQKRDDLSLARR